MQLFFWVFISSRSCLFSVILQASISFAQMAHLRPILPLDSVTFNKALAVYSRSKGQCYFLVVELFAYDSCFSSQWLKTSGTEGWVLGEHLFLMLGISLFLLVSLRKISFLFLGHRYSSHPFFKNTSNVWIRGIN